MRIAEADDIPCGQGPTRLYYIIFVCLDTPCMILCSLTTCVFFENGFGNEQFCWTLWNNWLFRTHIIISMYIYVYLSVSTHVLGQQALSVHVYMSISARSCRLMYACRIDMKGYTYTYIYIYGYSCYTVCIVFAYVYICIYRDIDAYINSYVYIPNVMYGTLVR